MRKSLSFIFLVACQTQPCYPEDDLTNFTDFAAPAVSDPGSVATLAAVVQCLAPLNQMWLSDQEAMDAECLGPRHIEVRSCLKIGIVTDWHLSPCTGEEVFLCDVGPERCEEKNETPTAECPCSCRAQIQDDTVVWSTPNHRLLAAYLVTLLTGCLSPWTSTLAPCSSLTP